ncbi:hypothetical protein M231_03106 [Tremella mesenterica]|uniref:Uncharacterized protein n=1 Tax=Tremella mesenterica TaxID=5217 RepID=A0A4Q1BNZ1_TREME|nr:hypothetical protein M231_03106 [Tremella mesenterica]
MTDTQMESIASLRDDRPVKLGKIPGPRIPSVRPPEDPKDTNLISTFRPIPSDHIKSAHVISHTLNQTNDEKEEEEEEDKMIDLDF